ncbi:MAG TPA: DNA gyrase modulator, partial [Acidimicrobiales bacterium]|nr:DNA gyrase modulator [Acidimicrobiales bacterium]
MTRVAEPATLGTEAAQDEPPITVVTPSRRWPSWMPGAATVAVIVSVIAVTLWQMHLNLLLTNTTTTGGDTGAHFVMPYFLKTHLLPSLRLTGWDPSWYAGYPIYTFYFVVPDLIAAVASYVIPYGIAFKLMTVLGSLLLPVAAWACGRLFKLRAPGPAALAAATLPFLFDYSWTIYGGNLFSTLAGEYAYSYAIPLALVFLGLFSRGLRSGRGRVLAAITLALCILCHIVPALLALAGAAVLVVLELLGPWVRSDDDSAPTRTGRWRARVLWWGASTVGLGIALSSWWLVPFFLDHDYATQMGYVNVSTFRTLLFPGGDLWALWAAAVAVPVALLLRSRFGILFSVLGALSALGLIVDPQGALYNVRLLPLWFLCVYLMVGWLAAIVVRRVAQGVRDLLDHAASTRSPPVVREHRFAPGAISGPLAVMVAALAVVIPPFFLPASTLQSMGVHPGVNQVSYWASWNYVGYEGAPAADEFYKLMSTMTAVGRRHGCGRAMWEYDPSENRFGTTEALMDLAYFTGGCIDSMEGLLFESSATTPYHFLNQAELSISPSDPMVGLPYGPVDVPLGIDHLQLLGVRYFMAFSPEIIEAAKLNPALRLVASTGPERAIYGGALLTTTWDVFEVADSAPVVGLDNLPAVLTGVGQAQSSWLDPSVSWYDDPNRWNVELAAGGPKTWPRVTATQRPPAISVTPAVVSHIREGTDTISFHVDRTGSPVLVKTSYFPNWVASGAQGPWRVTPNLMVVVPTAKNVTLSYGIGTAGKLGDAVTAGALLDDRRVEELSSGRSRGAGIRVVDGETTGFAHTADLSEAGLLAAARAAAAVARQGDGGVRTVAL